MTKNKQTKICVIDDNEAVCHSLEILLKTVYADEFDIESYSNPVAFLDEFSPEWKGCLIVDFFMPYFNGIDFIKELKRRECSMRFIIVSGHGNKGVAAQALKEGAQAFMSKPFNIELLLKNINDIFLPIRLSPNVVM